MAALFCDELTIGLFSGHLWCRSQIYQCCGKMAWVSAQCQNLEELSCLLPLKETGLPRMDSLASGYIWLDHGSWYLYNVQQLGHKGDTTLPTVLHLQLCSETLVGMAKQRWHCLHCGLRLQPQKACKVILVCYMLHNCARHIKLPPPPHDSDTQEDDDAGDEENDENPSLLLCILMFYWSITSNASICSVGVHASVMKWVYLYVVVSALGSYEMGCHK